LHTQVHTLAIQISFSVKL